MIAAVPPIWASLVSNCYRDGRANSENCRLGCRTKARGLVVRAVIDHAPEGDKAAQKSALVGAVPQLELAGRAQSGPTRVVLGEQNAPVTVRALPEAAYPLPEPLARP